MKANAVDVENKYAELERLVNLLNESMNAQNTSVFTAVGQLKTEINNRMFSVNLYKTWKVQDSNPRQIDQCAISINLTIGYISIFAQQLL